MQAPQITSKLDFDPTLDEIKKATIQAPEAPGIEEAKVIEETPEAPQKNPADFDEKPPQPEEEATKVEEEAPKTEEIIKEPSAMRKKMSAQVSAKLIVSFEDNAQQLIFPWLYTRMLFTSEDKAKIKQIERALMKAPEGFKFENTSDKALWEKYNAYLDLKEALPFAEDEKASLIECWDEIIKENPKMALSPWTALILAHATIFGTRLMPLMAKLAL